MNPIIKKKNNSEYLYIDGIYVRNYTQETIYSYDINHLFNLEDLKIIQSNEERNIHYPKISDEILRFETVVILSDGYDFEQRHRLLGKIPKNVCVLAVNGALKKWRLLDDSTPDDEKRTINGYVANNPYLNCLNYLPVKGSKYFPTCIASSRTNKEFLNKYMGDKYIYTPTPNKRYGINSSQNYYVEDYRNPICACINLAHKFKAKKVMLVCCDNAYRDKREGMVEVNGFWTYPQHVATMKIIDAMMYWGKNDEEKNIEFANFSSGTSYINAKYISNEQEALAFLNP